MATNINLNPESKDLGLHTGARVTTAEIVSTLGSGAIAQDVTDLQADGLVFEWDGGGADDFVSPIIGSSVRVSMLVDHNDELNAIKTLLEGGEKETYLKLILDNGEKWYGNLLPEEAVISITDGITELSLTFVDGLGLLKDIDFKDANGDLYSQGATAITPNGNLLKWAWLALEKIPWMQEGIVNANIVRETPFMEPDDGTQQGFYGTWLSDTFTPVKTFEEKRRNNDSDFRELPQANSFVSAYDVLLDICQTSGYRLCWNMTGWHFFSPLNSTSDYSLTSHTSFVWSTSDFAPIAAGSQGYNVAAAKTSNAFAPEFDLDEAYALSSASSRYAIPVGSTLATHLEVGSANIAERAKGFGAKYTETASWGINDFNRRKFQDTTMEVVDGASMRLRFHSYIDCYPFRGPGSDWVGRVGMKPCIVAKIAVGTQTGTTHYLKGDVKVAPETTRLTSVPGADIMGQSWDVFDDATWTTDSSDMLYVPFNSFDADPQPEAIQYLNSNGDTIYEFPVPFLTQLKPGEDNVIKEKRGVYENGVIDWSRTFDAPTGAGDFTGLQIELGIAIFSWEGDELYNSLDHTVATEMTTASDIQNVFNSTEEKRMLKEWEIWSCELGLGDTPNSDRTYFAEGGRGSIPQTVIETRLASRNNALWAGAPGTLVNYLADGSFDSNNDFRVRWETTTEDESNIDLLCGEYLRLLEGAAEGVESDLVPKFETKTSTLTPDRLAKTICLGGTVRVQPTALSFSSSSGARLSGYVVDKRAPVELVVKPPSVDIPTPVLGRPDVSPVQTFDTGTTSVFGKTTGQNVAANLEVQTQLALMDDGLLDLSAALGDGGTIVDGAYTGIAFDQTGAVAGNALVYNSDTQKWEPGAGGGGAVDLDFTQAFTTTDTVGNITAGTTISVGDEIETYLRNMVVSYQAPTGNMSSWNTSGKEHGSSYSDSNYSLRFVNLSNVNTAVTGTTKFTDTYNTNVTVTGVDASGLTEGVYGSFSISLGSGLKALVSNASVAGISGTSRSRSSCNKLEATLFENTNGEVISIGSKSHVTYFRSKLVRSSVNLAAGVDSDDIGQMISNVASSSGSSVLSSAPFSSYGNALSNVGSSDYVYALLPECIFTYYGGTITGIGTFQAVSEEAFGDVNATQVYCGKVDYEWVSGYPVRTAVIRLGQPGEYAGGKLKIT